MTPEQKAREEIDRQLTACGWIVQNHKAMNIMAGLGVAVREFPLKTGFADYLLYVDGKVIGLVEAKPEGHTLSGVEIQSSKYTLGLPDAVPNYRKPLPFAYESTGAVTQFTNKLVPQDYNDEPASVLLDRIRAARVSDQSPGKRAQPRTRSPSRGPRGADRAVRAPKRNLFEELSEGFDALKRKRDA